MAFSSAHVIMIEKIVIAVLVLCHKLPLDMSLPMLRCASVTVAICDLNFGTNLRDILSTSDSAGITLPNRYINLSDVITLLKEANQRSNVTSIAPAEKPYKMLSSVSGLPFEKYSKIVAPSWLKAGLINAVKITIDKQYFSRKKTLFLPSMLMA